MSPEEPTQAPDAQEHPPPPDVKSLVKSDRGGAFWRRVRWRVRRLPTRVWPRSRNFHRTSTYPSEPVALVAWTSLSLVAAAALVGFAALEGRGAGHVHATVFVEALAHTVTQPAVAVPVAFLLLALCGRCCRAARLAWLAWWPGPIDVADFTVPRPIDGTTPAQVTALFRDSLSLLRLDPAAPSPGATPEASFLDVLGGGGVSSSDVLKTLLTLVQASWPSHAFEVVGMIQEREGPKRCGISVHAVRLPGEPAALVEVWESSWEQAARVAADGAVAALLPRTRCCVGPWANWRGYRPPRELFTAYREAAELVVERRYDEALGRYRDALALDPTNLMVALQLGQLQEKIGLFLGALTTYQRILALDNPGAEPVPRGLYRRAARREWESSVRIAKYRQIVLLGQRSLVREWCASFAGEPESYREWLRAHFREQLKPLTAARGDPAADAIAGAIGKLIKSGVAGEEETGGGEETIQRVQQQLMPFAYKAAYELQRSLSRLESRPWRQPLLRRTVGLTLVSLRWRARLTDRVARGRPWPDDLPQKLSRAADRAGWTPRVWWGWRPPLGRRWSWQQLYNAACLYAIPLALECDARAPAGADAAVTATGAADAAAGRGGAPVGESPRRPGQWLPAKTVDELAQLAVGRLERAAARADNDFVLTRGAWVLEEDPDLRGLRTRPEFRAFAADYFPGCEEFVERARRAADHAAAGAPSAASHSRARIAQAEYAHSLLGAVATQWHQLWHQRAAREVADLHVLVRWCREEVEVWSMFGEVAVHHHDWLRRQKLLLKANEVAARDGLQPVVACYSRSDAAATPGEPASNGDGGAANGRATPLETCLDGLRAAFEPGGATLAQVHQRNLAVRLDLLRRADADARHPDSRAWGRRFCHYQAAVWQALEEWLSGETAEDGDPLGRVSDQLRSATHVWARAERFSHAQAWWRKVRVNG